MGKGGVGRSAISAATALLAARRGRNVLICEVNARTKMAELLGASREHDESKITELLPRIHAVNLNPTDSMKEYVTNILKMETLYNVVFDNRVMRYFLRAVPGLQELVMLGKVWHHTLETDADGSPRFDTVILDAPATGHGVALLRIPQVVLETVPDGPMKRETMA